MTIVAVEQSRGDLELITLTYELADLVNVGGPGPNKLLYCDTATVDYGDITTGPYSTVDFLDLGTAGPSSGQHAIYGGGGPASFTQMPGHTWGGFTFWAVEDGALPPNIHYFRAPFTPGASSGAITFSSHTSSGIGDPPGGTSAPFSWTGGGGVAADPIVIATSLDNVTGIVSATVYDGSALTTLATVFTSPGGMGHLYDPNGMKPDLANNRNLFLLSATSGGSYFCGAASNATGANIFADVLNFDHSDVNTMVTSTNVGQGFATATPDAWYFYWNRHTWDTILGNTPTNGGVLVKVANDFSEYWLYFLTWQPGDATAQATLDNTNNRPVICFDGAGVPYYQDALLYDGPILSTPPGPPSAAAPQIIRPTRAW